ncbi:MAG: patatin-like phospholipase family protein [bacterium]|nr:patatin-like phospholipase family protein [bacterium]
MAANYPFKNLVFQGGGVLGVTYAGVMRVLEAEGVLEQVERVAGTSAGAMASMLIGLRYSVDQLEEILLETDFKNFTTESKPLEFKDRYGWYSVRPLRTWLRGLIQNAGEHLKGEALSGDETFGDLNKLGCREIKVFATDLNTRSIAEFDHESTPDVRVVDAVCASLTIPAFFQSFQFPDNNPNDHIYVDGGALLNYPIMAFDPRRGKVNRETLGFALEEKDDLGSVSDLGFGTFRNWAEHLYETVKRVQSNLLNMHEEHKERTVFLDVGTISPVDFEITHEEKLELIENGKRATEDYLRLYRSRSNPVYKLLKKVGLVGSSGRK